ncbi:MAG: 16S rRNA (adenine(1518)-N(6)/adenine(1519)-N(6))-dimethyltransferase RsmA [Verrucomicrobiota bacterium]
MNRSAIQNTLAALQTRPTKSLGQNFLHDEEVASWIVDQLKLSPEDHLVEVGPGLGALSEYAIGRCRSATLIEKDGRLAEFLQERFAASPGVEVLHEDALAYDLRALFPRGTVKVLGNLPYYVSSQVLLAFTAEPSPVARLVFTLQKEMAERLSAGPSTKEYGAITLLVGRRWRVEYLRTLPGSVFLPAPNVESGVIALTPRPEAELPDCDARLFTRLVKEGFAQRRKMLRKMLSAHALDWPALCAAIGAEETVRGEALTLRQWVELARFVEAANAPEAFNATAQDVHGERFDVVDDANQVIGQASRHEVHTQKLKHRAVHILVFNAKGDLFLQKRSRWKDANPGKWDSSAAGHVNAGCGYDETAQRELQEELGVSAPLEPLGMHPASRETGWEFVQLYQARHNGPFTWPRAEIESGLFFPIPLLERWTAGRPQDFSHSFLASFRLWRENMR